MKHHTFLSCHPTVALLYFVLVLTFSVLLLHPLFLAASLLSALCCAAALRGGAAVRQGMHYLLPASLFAALVNVAFSHEGATILTYFPSGNPLTLESAVYGLAAAGLLAAILLWGSCWNAVISADKLMYLLGRVSPALSLLLAMTLRFVPRFQAKFREVAAARHGMGLTAASHSRLGALREAVTVFSIMVTWSLENAAETSDSMKSRGYGTGRRTAFSPFRLSARDRSLLAWLSVCGAYLAAGFLSGGIDWRYYPTLRAALTPYTMSLLLCHLALCLTPVILQRKEERAWSSTVSSI